VPPLSEEEIAVETEEQLELDKIEAEHPKDLTRTCFKVDLLSANDDGEKTQLDLKFKFKAGNPPESISRVVEKLNAQIIERAIEQSPHSVSDES
jgi:hypothetical protein